MPLVSLRLSALHPRAQARAEAYDREDEDEYEYEDRGDFERDEDGSGDENNGGEGDDDVAARAVINCDPAIYDKVLELREKRLANEDVMDDLLSDIADLAKTLKFHEAKELAVNKELAAVKEEIERFQKKKQNALNQLEVSLLSGGTRAQSLFRLFSFNTR